MDYKDIRLIIIALISGAILLASCSITLTKNVYNVTPNTSLGVDSIVYSLKPVSQSPISEDGQR